MKVVLYCESGFGTFAGKFFDQLWDDFISISDQAEIGNLENGCIRVLVNSYDDPRIFHASQVLDCS